MALLVIGWTRLIGAAIRRMLATGHLRSMSLRLPGKGDTMFVPARSGAPIRRLSPIVLGLLILCFSTTDVVAATFTVNSPADIVDANPGDGICRTAPDNTVCTLRAAIMEANALQGADTINLQANVTYILSQSGVDDTGVGGDLDILDSVTITGAGPGSTIIDGNGAGTGDRVMQIFRCTGNVPPGGPCAAGADVVVAISGVELRHGQPVAADAIGGGISNAGTLTLENCAVTDNKDDTALSRGGGLYNEGTLTLINCTVALNTLGIQGSPPLGAGIMSYGPLTIINSSVYGNVGDAPGAEGAGVSVVLTTAKVTGSTINGNHAGKGGGIYSYHSTLNLINTTISGNRSESSGGGIYVDGGTTSLYNVTLTDNRANADGAFGDIGGGVFEMGAATVTLANSIITNNVHVPDGGGPFLILDECAGTFISQGNNIVTYVIAGQCTIGGSYSHDVASLGPLQNNGGATLTHALLPGSKAIDAGNAAGCTDNLGAFITTDQRGVHRPNGAACDLGAYEFDDIIFQDAFDP